MDFHADDSFNELIYYLGVGVAQGMRAITLAFRASDCDGRTLNQSHRVVGFRAVIGGNAPGAEWGQQGVSQGRRVARLRSRDRDGRKQ